MFYLQSTTRDPHPHFRRLRAQQPVHLRRTQRVLPTQRRLLTNRPLEITDKEFHDNLAELKELESRGVLRVLDAHRRILDLTTFEVKEPPVPQANKKPLDDANNDRPRGRTFIKTDLSADVAANPTAPVEIFNNEPLPALVTPPEYEDVMSPALPVHGPVPNVVDGLALPVPSGVDTESPPGLVIPPAAGAPAVVTTSTTVGIPPPADELEETKTPKRGSRKGRG